MNGVWRDDTRDVPLTSYHEAQRRFFRYFAASPGVIRYGTFGSVGAPGLSDLDLIVVVEDRALAEGRITFPRLIGDETYIFQHPPLVVPESLLPGLPYYHLIDVKWSDGSEARTREGVHDLPAVEVLHVLHKTYYLQSYLWGLRLQRERPCKRAILSMTSLARSVEWLERLALPVRESERAYVREVLAFRAAWLASPGERPRLAERLDALLEEALGISLSLPETLSSHFLGMAPPRPSEARGRGLQRSPLELFLEAPVSDPTALVRAVTGNGLVTRMAAAAGRLRPLAFGKFTFVGPVGFSFMDLEYTLLAEMGAPGMGAIWGPFVDPTLRGAARAFEETLRRRCGINLAFARAMVAGGIPDSNFGGVWIPYGARGALLGAYGKALGLLLPGPRLLGRTLREIHTPRQARLQEVTGT